MSWSWKQLHGLLSPGKAPILPGSTALLDAGSHCVLLVAPRPSQLCQKAAETIPPGAIQSKQGEHGPSPPPPGVFQGVLTWG